jgi:beta-galactosidase
MLVEMIEQHFNHPSVLLWGMGNEIWLGKGNDGKALEFDFINRLNDTIHREDPVRKSVIVCDNDNYYSKLKIMTIPDVIGYNLYCGWYGGTVEKLTGRLEALHKLDPAKPLILSEFGAGCEPDQHSETPICFDQTQEYQLYFLESYLRQLDAMPWLVGYNWWNFADFGWAMSKIPKFYNNKGLLTFDRQKKDSFHFVKAAWSKDPVLYLCSPTWTQRTGLPDKQYKVISNMQEVELFLNGKTLGKQASGFVWNLTLAPGTNQLLARGARGEIVREHGFAVNYTPGNDAGPGMAPADLSRQAVESNPVKARK